MFSAIISYDRGHCNNMANKRKPIILRRLQGDRQGKKKDRGGEEGKGQGERERDR